MGYGVIGIKFVGSFWEPDFSWTFNEENVSLFVPIERIDSEVFGAFDEYEGTFGVEGTVEGWASGTGRDSDDEGILQGVAFWREIVIVVGLSWCDVEVACIIGMSEEPDG